MRRSAVIRAIAECGFDQIRDAVDVDLDPLVAPRRGSPPTMLSTCVFADDPEVARLHGPARRLHFIEQPTDGAIARVEEGVETFGATAPTASQMSRRLAVPERPRNSAMKSATVR